MAYSINKTTGTKLRLILLSLLVTFSLSLWLDAAAQTVELSERTENGFIRTHDSYTSGLMFNLSYNADKNTITVDYFSGQREVYSPDELLEIGEIDKDNKQTIYAFVSRTIDINGKQEKVFLKQYVFGEPAFYNYAGTAGRRIFYETNNKLTEVENNPTAIRSVLTGLTSDNEYTQPAIQYIPLSEKSLKKFFTIYRKKKATHFPLFMWGVQASYDYASIATFGANLNDTYKDMFDGQRGTSTFTISVYADMPIGYSNFYFHPELNVSPQSFSMKKELNESQYYEFKPSFVKISVPLMFRYIMSTYKVRPYVEAGVSLGYLAGLDNNKMLFSDDLSGRDIGNKEIVKDFAFEVGVGCGVLYHINYKNAVSLNVRYMRSPSFGDYEVGFSNWTAGVGFHF